MGCEVLNAGCLNLSRGYLKRRSRLKSVVSNLG